MAGETAMVKPTNKIVLDSKGIHIQTKKVETVTNVYPGRLVKKGTNDDDIVVNDGTSAIGWAGYEQTAKKYRPKDIDTIYVASDQIAVINGPGIVLLAYLEKGANVSKGALLKAGAIGGLTGGTVGTDHFYAKAEESVNASSAAADILVSSLI